MKKLNIKSESYLLFLIENLIMTIDESFDKIRILQEINAYELDENEEDQLKVLNEVLDSYIKDGLISWNFKTDKFEHCKY